MQTHLKQVFILETGSPASKQKICHESPNKFAKGRVLLSFDNTTIANAASYT